MEVIKNLAYFDDGGFKIDVGYDDATLRILRIIVNNAGRRDYTLTATLTSDRSRSYTIDSSKLVGLIDQSIPQGAAQRLQLSVTPSGKLDGVEWSIVELDAARA